MFKWLWTLLEGPSLPVHSPATGWMVKPANWKGRHGVTVFYEDLPENCFDCGCKTEEKLSDPLMIEGFIQYMTRTKFCPKGCGRTDWVA